MSKLQKSSKKEKLANFLDLPKEIILDYPHITLVGKSEISIENHKGLILYTNSCIHINTTCGVLKIEGKNFLIKKFNKQYLKILGTILDVNFK